MRPSLRFLAVAVIGWVGVRAASLGMLPGADLFRVKASQAATPPIAATQFPEIEPIAAAPTEIAPAFQQAAMPFGGYPVQMMAPPRPILVPIDYVYRTTPPPASNQAVWNLPEPRKQLYFPTDRADDWQVSRLPAGIPAQSRVIEPMQSIAPSVAAHRLDRIQMTMWAMLRRPQDASGSPNSLASGGTLGGSQAGARLMYNFTPAIAAVLRSSSDVGRRGGELAFGVRVRPLQSLPI